MSKVKVGQKYSFRVGFSVDPKREELEVVAVNNRTVTWKSAKTGNTHNQKREYFNHDVKMRILRKEVQNG